ncbi:MAG: hypothetical protein WCC04_09175 [Terriglobales bacterium]
MSRMLRTLLYSAVMFGLFGCALPSQAQQLDCMFTYTSAPADPSMTFCVSPNGNLTQLQIPVGPLDMVSEDYIGSTGLREGAEGYGVCQESPVASYFDYLNNWGEDTTTWEAATVVSQTATSIKIERTTADGNWTLTQTFTAEVKTPAVQVAMALHNNTKVAHVAYLVRVVETNYYYNYYSTSTQSNAFSWVPSSPVDNFGYGFLMSNVGTPQFGFMNSYVWAAEFLSNPCNFAGNAASTVVTQGSGIMSIAYVDTIGPKNTKSVTIRYSRLN